MALIHVGKKYARRKAGLPGGASPARRSLGGVGAESGFTLVEMLVVVGIIAVVSSVILFNYSDFSTNVSVRNLAQEVALSVRKAQTYATSVRTLDGTTLSSKTFPGYGISFATDAADPTNKTSPNARQFILFADDFVTSDDASAGTYYQDPSTDCGNPSSGNECLERIGITTADKVSAISVQYAGTSTDTPVSRVDISFRRPNPDAVICTSVNGKRCDISVTTITLTSAKGLRRTVEVWNTGQISVQ